MGDHVEPTRGYFPVNYVDRKLDNDGTKWPRPDMVYTNNGHSTALRRTDQGLEAVPGYFQMRHEHVGDREHVFPIFVNQFQRRRGTGLQKYHRPHIPLSANFLNNFTNQQLLTMRRSNGMTKLIFWSPSKYTPLKAYQWNRYLDEHPDEQHNFPIPRTPHDELPDPPAPYNTRGYYHFPDYNRKSHQWNFDESGNKTTRRTNIHQLHADELGHGGGGGGNDDDDDSSSDGGDDEEGDERGFHLGKLDDGMHESESMSESESESDAGSEYSAHREDPGGITVELRGKKIVLPPRKNIFWALRNKKGVIYVDNYIKFHYPVVITIQGKKVVLPKGASARWVDLTKNGKKYVNAYFRTHYPSYPVKLPFPDIG